MRAELDGQIDRKVPGLAIVAVDADGLLFSEGFGRADLSIRSGADKHPCWLVTAVQPPDHLVLLGAGTPADVVVPDTPIEVVPPKDYTAATWQWQLRRPHASGTATRLIVRQRLTYSPSRQASSGDSSSPSTLPWNS